jgi:hypothetical protein
VENAEIIHIIRSRFASSSSPARIRLQRGGYFSAWLEQDGIRVANLGTQPFLPWEVFTETVSLLLESGGRAERGDAMGARLGSPQLPFNSVEGRIAHRVYHKQAGQVVFRRISPISAVLVWAGICTTKPGLLVLHPAFLNTK